MARERMVRGRDNLRRIQPADAAIFFLPCLLLALLYSLHHVSPALYWRFVTPEHLNPGIPVLEWFQVSAYLGATVLSLYTAKQLRSRDRLGPCIICIAIALGTLFVALEEASYGQHLFKLKLSSSLAQFNSQGELTLHNFKPIQPHLHRIYVAFGLIGGLGWIARWRCLPFSVRDLLFIEFRFSLFFWQIAGYYLYLDSDQSVRVGTPGRPRGDPRVRRVPHLPLSLPSLAASS